MPTFAREARAFPDISSVGAATCAYRPAPNVCVNARMHVCVFRVRAVPHAARAPRESPPTPEEAGWGTQGAAIWRAKYAQESTNSSPRMKADGYPSTPPRAPADPSRSQHAPAGRPEGRSAGFRGKMQIRSLGLFPGPMALRTSEHRNTLRRTSAYCPSTAKLRIW